MTQISYGVLLFLDILEENEQLLGLEDSAFTCLITKDWNRWSGPALQSYFLAMLPMVLNAWTFTTALFTYESGGGERGDADRQMLKDLRVTCAYGHNFLQAPSV